MIAALLLVAAATTLTEAPDWFRVYQYAPKPAVLRGCSECQGEPDDVCEVRAGAQSRALLEYAGQRAKANDRVKLLRSKADPDCAVHAKPFFGPRGTIEMVALRLARTPPSQALIDRFGVRQAVAGWPRAPQRRSGQRLATAAPDRASLRLGLLCWGSERAWPVADLGPGNACEWWLLPVRADNEPDLTAKSFPVITGRDHWPESFRFADARWSRAFDRAAAFDESILLGEEAHPQQAQTTPAPPPPPPIAAPAVASVSRCNGEGNVKPALLDRFDQWEAQIVGARRSLDRTTWTVDAAAWSGHCQELDVLRSALEQQLGCALLQEGRCVGPAALREEPR